MAPCIEYAENIRALVKTPAYAEDVDVALGWDEKGRHFNDARSVLAIKPWHVIEATVAEVSLGKHRLGMRVVKS